MDNKIEKYLEDILICITNIDDYIGVPKTFENYNANFLLQDAVERNIITIGEAMNSILKIEREIAISNSRKIVDARNKLTHGYDDIENLQIWSIIVNYLPILKIEILDLKMK